ncbi:type 4b pilus protein PilO2 [Photorhabdus africana]|uniref:type 4b pilus protein PilO2 n=1 Tax=Photorhabdus africana TaxID=3097554 RepID=UPI002B41092E|nr:type 4b pilus protein PilO2 [Photorhabdus sp. CRI-LC]
MSGMPFDVVFQGKTPLIAGLNWQTVESISRRECRAKIKDVDASSWVMVPGLQDTLVGHVQLGLSELTTAQARRACSLALVILPLLNRDGWGVFHLHDDRYWFVAATDGRLSPLSDVTGTAAEIHQVLERYLDYIPAADSRTIFCPEGFSANASAEKTPLTSLLSGQPTGKSCRLRPISNRLPVIIWSLIAIAALAGWLGMQYYDSVQQQKKIELARKALLEAKKKANNSASPVIKPWLQQPRPSAVAKACAQGWNVPISVAGSKFSEAECADGKSRIAWRIPKGGNVADFRARAQQLFPGYTPYFNIPGAADMGGISFPVTVPPSGSSDELPDADEVTQRLTSYGQRLGFVLNLAENNTPTADIDNHTIPLLWRSWRFTFQTDIPVDRLFGTDISDTGIRINGIKASMRDARLHYQVQGTLYAKP